MNNISRRPINLEGESLITPIHLKPFENRQQLYLMHFFFAFVSRMWDMGIVLLVAQLTNNSLFLVAITGLCSSMSIFLFMGSIGSFLDKTNRIVAVRLALFMKIAAVSAAYVVCAYLNYTSTFENDIFHEKDSFRLELLYSLPIISAIASMSFCAITQSIEKDWIVVLSSKDSIWLSKTNSIMTQIDLACSSVAPALTGLLFAYLSHTTVSIILMFINIISTIVLYIYMYYLYHSWLALGQKVGVDVLEATDNLNVSDLQELALDIENDTENETETENKHDSKSTQYGSTTNTNNSTTTFATSIGNNNTGIKGNNKERMSIRSQAEWNAKQSRRMSADAVAINTNNSTTTNTTTYYNCCYNNICSYCNIFTITNTNTTDNNNITTSMHPLRDFFYSGCAGMMISYAALYLTVLSFGSLMTVYIRSCGITDDMIGLYRGLAALSGYTGAVLFPSISTTFGLWRTGQYAILYQFILIAIAASSFFWSKNTISVYIVIFATVSIDTLYI